LSGTASHSGFSANAREVGRLLEIHARVGGTRIGRRDAALQALNRAGIVLVCTIWQSYCEDLAAEALEQMRHPPRPARAVARGRSAGAAGLVEPQSLEVDALFSSLLGLPSLSEAWYWSGMSAAQARRKLDRLILMRTDIAHGGSTRVRRRHVTELLNHTQRIVAKTDTYVVEFVRRG
jgi:hypothetical protein